MAMSPQQIQQMLMMRNYLQENQQAPVLDSRMIPQAPQLAPAGALAGAPMPQAPAGMPAGPQGPPSPYGAPGGPVGPPQPGPGQGPSPVALAQQQWAQKLRQQYPSPTKQGWGSMLGSVLAPALVGKLAGGSGTESLLYGVGSAAQNFNNEMERYRQVESQIAGADAILPQQEAKYARDIAAANYDMARASGKVGAGLKVNSSLKTRDENGRPVYKLLMSDGSIVATNEEIYEKAAASTPGTYVLDDLLNPETGVVESVMINNRNPQDRIVLGQARPTPTDVKMAGGAADQLAALPASLRAVEMNTDSLIGEIDGVLDDAAWYNTGVIFGGEGAQNWLQSSANLAAKIRTISANTAFDRLQEIRDAAKSGGGLGAVSERELDLLRDARVAIAQSQSEDQLRDNLEKLKIRYQATMRALKNDAKFKEWSLRLQAGGAPPTARLPAQGAGAPGSPQIPAVPQPMGAPPQPQQGGQPGWQIINPQTPGAPAADAKSYLDRVRSGR